jgi:hypothetical protein
VSGCAKGFESLRAHPNPPVLPGVFAFLGLRSVSGWRSEV